jgi:3-hydroxyisobutyrate dehydrogenase
VSEESRPPKPQIGFIGLGNMGCRMATRLIDAGYLVTVSNRTRSKTRPLAQRGAQVADTPRALTAACTVVMSSVPNDAAVEEVMFGPDGALAGARPGTVFVDLSTVYPATSRKVFAAAKQKGCAMLDAAVSGSTPQAEAGTLVILIGGEQDTYQQVKPVLDVLGREQYYMGPSGSGATMKIVVNTLLGLGMQAVAEAVALGVKAGLEKNRLIDVLGQTAVVSPSQKAKLENGRREDYPVTFALRLMWKDLGLVLRLAQENLVPMPATATAHQMCTIENARMVEEDFSAVIRLMEELAGISTHGSHAIPNAAGVGASVSRA